MLLNEIETNGSEVVVESSATVVRCEQGMNLCRKTNN